MNYSKDTEFGKLFARQADVELAVANLELARDVYPDLDFAATIAWLDGTADEIRPLLARTADEREALEIIAQTIALDHGIVGSPDAYDHAESSYLSEVIRRKQGLPIAISVLYIEVCRRLDIDLRGVAAPMHFITRLETINGPVFLDGFAGNRILSEEETVEWLAKITQLPSSEMVSYLQPTTARDIMIRSMMNLKAFYVARDMWHEAWQVLNRLYALSPTDYSTRRDLAFAAARSHRTGEAIKQLKNLLLRCRAEDREAIETELEQTQRQLHQWN